LFGLHLTQIHPSYDYWNKRLDRFHQSERNLQLKSLVPRWTGIETAVHEEG